MKLTEREEALIDQMVCNLFNRGLCVEDNRDEDHDPNFDMVKAEFTCYALNIKKEIYTEISDLLLNHAMTNKNINDDVIEPVIQKQKEE